MKQAYKDVEMNGKNHAKVIYRETGSCRNGLVKNKKIHKSMGVSQ
ncbi:hypothetical protein [Nitrosomonas sp.]|nr:hypothetical protein [Nitrosomonas sp.]